jgi:hypothetical protein
MSLISNDRFPDVPMSTQGANSWHADSLGNQIEPEATDGIPGGQNMITIGDDGGFTWQRARPSGSGTFHEVPTEYPGNTLARQA